MEVVTLYRYGNTVVSPVKPNGEYETLFRLIADEGKLLEKDGVQTPCVDTDSAEGWKEIDAPAGDIF